MITTMHGAGRAMRVTAYLLLTVVGAWTFYQVGDVENIDRPLWWAMAAWMGAGGVLSLAGQVSRRWTGEFVGLPLLGTSLIGFAVLQASLHDWSLGIFSSTALLMSFGLILLSRWRDVLVMYRTATIAAGEAT